MMLDEFIPIIEAMLFSSGDPIAMRQISKTLKIENAQAQYIMDKLMQKFDTGNFGIKIIKINDKYQMCSNPKYAQYVESILNIHQSPVLSPPAMEVLAIIAYNEPVTKNFIQNIRGVDSSGIISNLIVKKLVKESGRLDIPGKPIIYSTTENFLRCFGITSTKYLPEISKVRK